MAVDIYLVVDGIKGESQDDVYKDEIDVLAWNWGMTQSGTTHMGPGAGGGKVNVSDITFTKKVDKATPDLLKACTSGKHINEATLIVRKAGGDSPVEYFKLKMTTVLVTSYQTGGARDGLDRIEETLSFNFREFTVTYTQQEASGTAGASADAGWNIAENKAA
jgi:type VI secretion system secreted protein Hcp